MQVSKKSADGGLLRALRLAVAALMLTPGLARIADAAPDMTAGQGASEASAAAPVCAGTDLIAALPKEDLQALEQAAALVPYPEGLFWRARRGDDSITIIGTYHFADPRHAVTLARFGPDIDAAATLMVEAGPDEQEKLKSALLTSPDLIMDVDGPSLPERLTPQDWQAVSRALKDRGIPPVIGSRMRPWYVSMMMGISPCMIGVMRDTGTAGGLDEMLMQRAQAADVPVRALEPWDTLFALFQNMTDEEEIEMILAGLPAAAAADDYAQTLANAYFGGKVRLIWEFTRADAYEKSGLPRVRVDEQIALAEHELMEKRNIAWITPIEKAASGGKPVVVAFGALHLPGDSGVLRLLENRGWTITALPLADAPAQIDDKTGGQND